MTYLRKSTILRVTVGLGGLAATGLVALLWALWWPPADCFDPACARPRFTLFVEVDAFRGIAPVPLDLETPTGTASLTKLFASGGIDVTVAVDEVDLPYDAAARSLDRTDLYQYATVWRTLTAPPGADAKIYAMVSPGLVADTGERLFGLMFDYAGREGFAVAPGETIGKFALNEESRIPLLQLRTFAHELLHALNRSHIDAARLSTGLTVEAPTRCIADIARTGWKLKEEPLFALSPETVRFFQTATAATVLPGRDHIPYDLTRTAADECELARRNVLPDPVSSRWAYALRRLRNTVGIRTATAAESTEAAASVDGEVAATLRLQAQPAAYPWGYPIAVRLLAHNIGTRPLPLHGRLLPGFGLVQIEVRADDEDAWRVLRPAAWFEPSSDRTAMLEPGASTEQTVPIFFDGQGWTFARPGEYWVRARLRLGEADDTIVTDPVRIDVVMPHTERDSAALAPLLDATGALSVEMGRFLDTGSGSDRARTVIEKLIAEFPDTALGAALRLNVATQSLRPPIDPRTGSRAPPDLAGAKALLTDACTDSGIAALKHQLSQRHPDWLGGALEERTAQAWDGRSRVVDNAVPTYSDPTLRTLSPAVHFCVDEARLPRRSRMHRLAREIRALRPERIVVVGHTDSTSSCQYNDRLGLERAAAVKRALVRAGIRSRRIVTMSLGERRPLDFALDPAAHARNRRVEILLDAATVEKAKERIEARFGRYTFPTCE